MRIEHCTTLRGGRGCGTQPRSSGAGAAPWRARLAMALIGTILASVPCRTALGWGRLGHRVAGAVAEARLSPAARAAVRELLEPGESLADASTWADEHRRDVPDSGPWHYVNVPITETRYDARFCDPRGCVVSKIAEYRRVLADPSAPKEDRRLALRLVAHFVQDLHQPLHVGDRGDRGGNDLQLQFFGQGSNLHRIWDSGLLERDGEDEPAMVRSLSVLARQHEADWDRGTVEDWATESLSAAKVAYLVPNGGGPLRKGASLGRSYQSANISTARKRVAQSGVRVASLLNASFP
jgi:nuclease S1